MRPEAGDHVHSKTCGVAQAFMLVLAIAGSPSSVDGQTYRERAGRPAPAHVDGLPDRLATRPAPGAANEEQGRGGESQPASSGQQLVSEAARRVFALSSLHARLRMKFRSQDRPVTATGEYMQLGAGAENLVRLDLKIPIGSKIGSVQEIRGREYLWLIKDLPPDAPKLERVELRRARINIVQAKEAGRMTPLEGWMLLGGLSRLLNSLDSNFEFGDPRPATLADVQVLLVRGKWKPASLTRLTGGLTPEKLPQLPHEVELTLGGSNGALPLFPYRIEYLRHSPDPEQGRGVERSIPLTTIEFYEVQPSADLSPQEFDFSPEDRESEDVTMPYLRKLGLVPAKSP